MSRRDLAELCDLPYSTIRQIVSMQRDPLLVHAITVSSALEKEVEDLFALLPRLRSQSAEAEP